MIYFYSDPHFYHHNVIQYSNRPFNNIDEMNERLIQNYNSVVRENDIVYFLGDVFFCNQIKAKELLSRLNGKKILIRGNHDLSTNRMYHCGFDVVCESMMIKSGKTKINLSHYPYQYSFSQKVIRLFNFKPLKRRNEIRRLINNNEWLIHGHTHSINRCKNKMINVCVEAWNYFPVSINEIHKIINQYENRL